MDIKDILSIGIGRAGNALVDNLMAKDKRYYGMLVNSSEGDMTNLECYDRASKFLIPGANGAGRDQKVAEGYARNSIQRFADEIMKHQQFKMFVVYFSMSGGTGSAVSPIYIKAIKRLLENAKIMVVAVMPSNNASKVELENTLACWDELMTLRDNKVINGVRLIDNDKREYLDEINRDAIIDIDTGFKLNTFDVNGMIDQKDSFKINSANDYMMVYNLNNNVGTLREAIRDSAQKSVFVKPQNLACDYLGALLQRGKYEMGEVKRMFDVYETDYIGLSNGRNVIVASGMNIPVSKIESIQESLREFNTRSRSRVKDSSLYVHREGEESVTVVESKKVNSVTSEELDRIFNDDFFN